MHVSNRITQPAPESSLQTDRQQTVRDRPFHSASNVNMDGYASVYLSLFDLGNLLTRPVSTLRNSASSPIAWKRSSSRNSWAYVCPLSLCRLTLEMLTRMTGLDVLETRPALLRRLRHRLYYQIAHLARGGLRDALCGQVAQGFGTAERTVPGTERGYDGGPGSIILSLFLWLLGSWGLSLSSIGLGLCSRKKCCILYDGK